MIVHVDLDKLYRVYGLTRPAALPNLLEIEAASEIEAVNRVTCSLLEFGFYVVDDPQHAQVFVHDRDRD